MFLYTQLDLWEPGRPGRWAALFSGCAYKPLRGTPKADGPRLWGLLYCFI